MTSQSRALAVTDRSVAASQVTGDPFQLAAVFYKSGLFKDVRDEAQAAVKILYGQELGIPPMQAMLGVYVVDGKPTLAAATLASIIKRSGRYTFRPVQHDATVCTLAFFERVGRAWEPLGESSFSMAEAQTAGLAGKATWKQYPKAMLWARALSQGARWYCADVFGGPVYTQEEFGAEVDEDGVVLPPPPAPLARVPAPRAAVAVTASATTDEFDPDAEPRPDAELHAYMPDGTPVWTVAGVQCVLHASRRYLVSIDRCPAHDVPFNLPLSPEDLDWRHGKAPHTCLLAAVATRVGVASDLSGMFDGGEEETS